MSVTTFAVIPAAGLGSRLGLGPKILVEIESRLTVWSVLSSTLFEVVDEIVLVISPAARPQVELALAHDPNRDRVHIAEQPEPIGMGDAIFRGYDIWNEADRIVVVWGDQVLVSPETVRRALQAQAELGAAAVVPVVSVDEPYVEYVFSGSRLVRILQTREGDTTTPGGYGDVGTFVLAVADLKDAWNTYLAQSPRGAATGEVNFLPFLVHLAGSGATVASVVIADQREARGINTVEDLEFARRQLEAK